MAIMLHSNTRACTSDLILENMRRKETSQGVRIANHKYEYNSTKQTNNPQFDDNQRSS
jgi:hypothetical protein